jgi:hypothetical protein
VVELVGLFGIGSALVFGQSPVTGKQIEKKEATA